MFGVSLCAAAYLGFALLHLGHDKAIHFTTFFILTAEFYFIWETHRPWKLSFLVMTLGASISLEFVQGFVNPSRVFDPMDIVYNVHGSVLALVACSVALTALARRRRPAQDDEVDGYVQVNMSDLT